jgi:hypothetical protein
VLLLIPTNNSRSVSRSIEPARVKNFGSLDAESDETNYRYSHTSSFIQKFWPTGCHICCWLFVQYHDFAYMRHKIQVQLPRKQFCETAFEFSEPSRIRAKTKRINVQYKVPGTLTTFWRCQRLWRLPKSDTSNKLLT